MFLVSFYRKGKIALNKTSYTKIAEVGDRVRSSLKKDLMPWLSVLTVPSADGDTVRSVLMTGGGSKEL